jgi:hypothetical protein
MALAGADFAAPQFLLRRHQESIAGGVIAGCPYEGVQTKIGISREVRFW